MPIFFWLAGLLALGSVPSTLSAQWPGEIRGQVIDELSGRPVPAADVQLLPGASRALTTAGGAFHFRGLEPGRYTIRAGALGYATTSVDVDVLNGVVLGVQVVLPPAALSVPSVDVSLTADAAGVITLGADRIRSTVGSTAADVLRGVPGVLIVTTAAGGPQTPTIRGSGTDAVLVLVDGVPINDPITGTADLSLLPLSALASITVLPGGQSARYGARASAGAILIRTGSPERNAIVGAGAGSYGERSGQASGSLSLFGGEGEAQGTYRSREGAFDFELPPAVGGGAGRNTNADSQNWTGRLGWKHDEAGRQTMFGVSAERTDRGLPGRSFAPSPSARQGLTQARLFGSGERTSLGGRVARFAGYLQYYRSTFRDVAPPFGEPFDDLTTLIGAWADASLSRTYRHGTLGAGADAKHLRVESTVLSTSGGSPRRTDLGAWLSASVSAGPFGTAWTGTVRVDRAGFPEGWFGSHDVGVRATVGPLLLRAGHRSSFSPPTLGDQFFREGVGIEPNPDLRAERVPSEWIGGVTFDTDAGNLRLSLDAEAYVGNIRGMIIWLPDFRFVWSPRNHDVNRRGLDVRARVQLPARGLETWVDWSLNRTTYDRPSSDDVQVVYRPRYQGGIGASLTRSAWSIMLDARFTGARFPVPNAVNELPAFWTTNLRAQRTWAIGSAFLNLQMEIERLFDRQDTLIFAFPHPGRTFRVTLQVGPAA